MHWIWKPYALYQDIDYVRNDILPKLNLLLTTYSGKPRFTACVPTKTTKASQMLSVRTLTYTVPCRNPANVTG